MADHGPIIVKRKKVVAAGHHGGSWKVAYADFVTAMMAFFMVMWIMGMDPEIKSMVQGYFNDPLGFIKNPPKSKTPFQVPGSPSPKPGSSSRHGADIMENTRGEKKELDKIKKEFQAQIESDPELKGLLKNVEMTLTDEGLRIEFLETSGAVFFQSGSAAILPNARKLIARIAPVLARSGRKVIVEGHTDAAPYASASYSNWDLSTDRAQSMRKTLAESGVKEGQFFEVRGYAATKLRRPDQPLDFSNRRVSVLLPFKTETQPMADLPAEAFKDKIEGAFRQPLDIAP
jgi:chemotaxis protein MotB